MKFRMQQLRQPLLRAAHARVVQLDFERGKDVQQVLHGVRSRVRTRQRADARTTSPMVRAPGV